MSLVAFGIRIAMVQVIRQAVWSSFTVEDSPQAPIDLLEDGAPLIAVFTGHDNDKMDGRDLFGGQPTVSLTIQIFLPSIIAIDTPSGPITIDVRRNGAETVLDVVSRRILRAMLAQADPWSRLLFDLIQKTSRAANASYLVETQKVRTSAREMTMLCDVIHEPIPGAPPSDVWADLVALMRTDTDASGVALLADWIAAEIEGPEILSQAERDRIDLGLSRYAAQAIAIGGGVVESVDDQPGAAAITVSADPAAPAPDGYTILAGTP